MKPHLGLLARICTSAFTFKLAPTIGVLHGAAHQRYRHTTVSRSAEARWQHGGVNGTAQQRHGHTTATTTVSSSAELVARWQHGLLLQFDSSQDNEQLRQLCRDAISVYSKEGASSVVPDSVTDVFMAAYTQLAASEQQQLQFFKLLVSEFGVQRQALEDAVQLFLQRAPLQQQPTQMYRLAERLSAAAQPLYMPHLLLPISQHKEGIWFLVNMRADLLSLLQQQPAAALEQQGAALRALDQDLRAALARWFSLGLLQLQRITWEHSSGQVLQRVLNTEAVHKMSHLEELQRRLQQSDRRVFAFFHPSLPDEPLVVLHTAILSSIPCSMQEVLTPQQQDQGAGSCARSTHSSSGGGVDDTASVACFYSISNGQPGLAGVDLGNFLIKKAAQLLLSELPQLKTLVTLSPIPGFRTWLLTKLRIEASSTAAATGRGKGGEASSSGGSGREQSVPALLQAAEVTALLQLQQGASGQQQHNGSSSDSSSSGTETAAAAEVLLRLVQDNGWVSLPLPQHEQVVRRLLLRLCAVYLLTERRRNLALDPVAHFHLRNGAQLWRLNWRADMSAQGLANSCGLMVNYLYSMPDVVSNNQRYLLEHHINASQAVQQLLLL